MAPHCALQVAGLAMVACFLCVPSVGVGDDHNSAKPGEKEKMVAGKSEMLRHVPKKFATLQAVEAGRRQVQLLLEGEKEPRTWRVNADAEIKVLGWWGRLDHLHLGDRVWVWFDLGRQKQLQGILMLADEISEQDIHDTPPTLETADPKKGTITLKPAKGQSRTLKLSDALRMKRDGDKVQFVGHSTEADVQFPQNVKLGEKVYVQTAGETVRLVLSAAGLEKLRERQRLALREIWTKEGLPGTVTFLHPLSGEMEVMLDHEAIRWGRYLKTGDKVKLNTADPMEAQVKEVRPWRERTQLRLVMDGFAQSGLAIGQRLELLMPSPPLEVDQLELPPDLDRPRSKQERIEWFLCSTYCSCSIAGDTCTGMFYTLASCNVNACGMPNYIRERVAEMIDRGLTDKQIFEELKKTQGPLMLRPHLLP